ncbi:MAG TPA: DUF4255 domain-containing protein [Pyrinomonadaceae bacterium]
MSTALAIASVTAVLRDLLNNGMIDQNISGTVGSEVLVTALPPDRILKEGTAETSQLNLFLYQVTPNAGWRNVGLPSRNGRGERLTNPPLALDLHYLLSAYGEKDFHAEILLGYAMQLFHETPVLTREKIRLALAPPTEIVEGTTVLPTALRTLFESELAEQIEQVKISPVSMSTEEISRLWSAFQTRYRPTAAYQASVVLIESRSGAARPALPVLSRNILAVPFRQPVIENFMSQENDAAPILADQPILPGHNLNIIGTGLRGDDTHVHIGGVEISTPLKEVTDTRITFALPPNLRAGVQGAQVVHYRSFGTPKEPHRGVASNVSAFVLRPMLGTIGAATAPGQDADHVSGELDIAVSPAIGRDQRVVLLLNELDAPANRPPWSYSFRATSPYQLFAPPSVPPETVNEISIPIVNVRKGKYLVRLQVDGAESVPKTDPLTKKFSTPQVDIV